MNLGESWRKAFQDWLSANKGDGLSEFEVWRETQGGNRPEKLVVVAFTRIEPAPKGMDFTGRIHGVVAIREPVDDATLEEHEGRAEDLWETLKGLTWAPGPFAGIHLHDVRWTDRQSGERDEDRVTAWEVNMLASELV